MTKSASLFFKNATVDLVYENNDLKTILVRGDKNYNIMDLKENIDKEPIERLSSSGAEIKLIL